MTLPPLTLRESVSLGTVLVQQRLREAGVASLAIKGPAFVQLGVRQDRQSNDIDLLIHRDDRVVATRALVEAGWDNVSHWFPPALDDVIYSTTFRHRHFPSTVDVHHTFSGLLTANNVFATLWGSRVSVEIAHQPVDTLSAEHALVIEALNVFKMTHPSEWDAAALTVIAGCRQLCPELVAKAAESVGARHTAGSLVAAIGGPAPRSEPPKCYWRWRQEAGSDNTRMVIAHLVRRAPHHIPRVAWQQLTLTEDVARFWASAHGVEYRSPRQILGLRIKRLLAK